MIVKIVQKILEATNLHFGFGPVFGYLFRFTGLQNRTVLKVILTRCHYMILKFPVKEISHSELVRSSIYL